MRTKLAALAALSERGYPTASVLWHGPLDDRWSLVIHAYLPGTPLATLDEHTLDNLLELVELQAELDTGPGGWDLSEWISSVLFDGWERWWEEAERVPPGLCRRLRTFIEPAWGHRMPSIDLVHHDFNLSNVLVEQGVVSGVVDWDDAGRGSRAIDLTALLFDWHRLRLEGDARIAPDGGARLVARIVQVVGEDGLRCTVTYAAVAELAIAARRGERDQVDIWRRVSDAVLDVVS